MTTLANRRALDKHFTMLASDTDLASQPISMIVADIDHFKLYNDFIMDMIKVTKRYVKSPIFLRKIPSQAITLLPAMAAKNL